MKKVLTTFCFCTLLLGGCATPPGSSESVKQQQWQEKNIKSNINALNQAPQYKGKVRVTSEINHGTVLLMGQSINEQNKQFIESYVANLQGVDKIYNQIRIGQPISFDKISHDIWLTTRVKAALLSDDRLDRYNVSVTTENKEVFLMGDIPAAEAQIAADIARTIDDVSKVIKAFNYITSRSNKVQSPSMIADETVETQADEVVEHNVEIPASHTPVIEEISAPISESDLP